jgi:hypothetical protein
MSEVSDTVETGDDRRPHAVAAAKFWATWSQLMTLKKAAM